MELLHVNHMLDFEEPHPDHMDDFNILKIRETARERGVDERIDSILFKKGLHRKLMWDFNQEIAGVVLKNTFRERDSGRMA
jgi:hypothetical protein